MSIRKKFSDHNGYIKQRRPQNQIIGHIDVTNTLSLRARRYRETIETQKQLQHDAGINEDKSHVDARFS